MSPIRSCPINAWTGGMWGSVKWSQENIAGQASTSVASALLHERTIALVERPGRIDTRHRLDQLVIIPRPFRLLRLFHLEQIHVADDAAVDAQGAVLGHEVVDRRLAHLPVSYT